MTSSTPPSSSPQEKNRSQPLSPSGRHSLQSPQNDVLEESIDVDLSPLLEQSFTSRRLYILFENALFMGVLALISSVYLYIWGYISWPQGLGISFEGMLFGVIWGVWKGPLLVHHPIDLKKYTTAAYPQTMVGAILENLLSHCLVMGFYCSLVFGGLWSGGYITWDQAREGAGVVVALAGFRGLFAGIHEYSQVVKAREFWAEALPSLPPEAKPYEETARDGTSLTDILGEAGDKVSELTREEMSHLVESTTKAQVDREKKESGETPPPPDPSGS